jgi:transcriptional regulator with XRE-family HTH domain
LLRQEELFVEVTEKICEYMERENVSRSELAKRLDVSKGWITQILSGGRNLTLRTLSDVADALGYEVKLRFKPSEPVQLEHVSYERDWTMEKGEVFKIVVPSVSMTGRGSRSVVRVA